MALINNVDQLRENIQVLETALISNNDEAINLVRKGMCFVVSERDGKLSFGPSRFLGYKNNTIAKHLKKKPSDSRCFAGDSGGFVSSRGSIITD